MSENTSSTQILLFKLNDSEKFNGENWTDYDGQRRTTRINQPLGKLCNHIRICPISNSDHWPQQPYPNEYEYAQRESCALSFIICNVTDIFGFGLNTRGTSHATWTRLKTQYGAHSDLVQNCWEKILWANIYYEGGKVSGDGGHIKKMSHLLKKANNVGVRDMSNRWR